MTMRSSEEQKKWFQRLRQNQRNKKLFSKFSAGIRINATMSYSVTKEMIAQEIARRVVEKGYASAVDACGGAGGNTIAFASAGLNVAYVEINENNFEDAIHNAGVYDVSDSIYFHHGDIFEFNCLRDSGLQPTDTFFFSSPEWGGPSYKTAEVFDLEKLSPPLSELLDYARQSGFREAAIFVPRTSDIHQASEFGCTLFEYMFLEGWCDSACLWFDL